MTAVIAPLRAMRLNRVCKSEADAVFQGYGIKFQKMRARGPRHLLGEPPEKNFRLHDNPWLQYVFLIFEEPGFFGCQISLRGFFPIFVRITWPIQSVNDLCHPSACDRVRSMINQKTGFLRKPRCSSPLLHIKQNGDVTERLPTSLAVDPRDPYVSSTF